MIESRDRATVQWVTETQEELQWCVRRQLLATANRGSILRQEEMSTTAPSRDPLRQ